MGHFLKSTLSQFLTEIQTFEILRAIRTGKNMFIISLFFMITNLRKATSLNKFDTTSAKC